MRCAFNSKKTIFFTKKNVIISTHKKKKACMTGFLCDPDWIRTNGPQLRRLMLYPTELPDQLSAGAEFGQQI